MTEPLSNPNYCRNLVYELAFECYGVPRIGFGVDGMFSMYGQTENTSSLKDGLVINVGQNSTHVLPILGGQLRYESTTRISLGSYHS